MDNFNKKSKFETCLELNSLVIVPHILINVNTIIDLRNETTVVGKIDEVDGFMNISMVDVVFIDQQLRKHPFKVFHIPSRMIRYIHIPKYIDINSAVGQHLEQYNQNNYKKKSEKNPKRNFKMKRAQQNHLRTLQENFAKKKEEPTAEKK